MYLSYIYHTKIVRGRVSGCFGAQGMEINGVSNDMTRLKISQFNRERRGNHIRGVECILNIYPENA